MNTAATKISKEIKEKILAAMRLGVERDFIIPAMRVGEYEYSLVLINPHGRRFPTLDVTIKTHNGTSHLFEITIKERT